MVTTNLPEPANDEDALYTDKVPEGHWKNPDYVKQYDYKRDAPFPPFIDRYTKRCIFFDSSHLNSCTHKNGTGVALGGEQFLLEQVNGVCLVYLAPLNMFFSNSPTTPVRIEYPSLTKKGNKNTVDNKSVVCQIYIQEMSECSVNVYAFYKGDFLDQNPRMGIKSGMPRWEQLTLGDLLRPHGYLFVYKPHVNRNLHGKNKRKLELKMCVPKE